MRLKDYKISLGIALLFHVMVIFALTKVYWPDISKVGWQSSHVIQSYLYKPKQVLNTTHTDKDAHAQQYKVKKPAYKKTRQHESSNNKSASRSNLTKGQHNRLLIALHNIIEQNQAYPNNARLLGQQGSVKISFELLPSGDITAIRVLQSSGYDLLDQAAMNAVAISSPFIQIRVKKPVQLQLMLVYK